ncbi:MAG: GNAT family N-acetyltransferase [Ornithinibacter sp.]
MITLIRPEVLLHDSYLEASDEFGEAQRDGDGDWVEPADKGGFPGRVFTREELTTKDGFTAFVRWRLDRALPDSPRPTGHVSCTYFWVVDDADPLTYLGSLSLRHDLTPFLLDFGGHIGYSVRPSARQRGVATAALRLGLGEARAMGIDPALLTCHVANGVSRRVIETCGGVFEDIRVDQRRYWVPTSG